MPTYEYKCSACGYAFERFQSMSADPVKKCPECGKSKVKRLLGTGAGLIFKGSGFYITDYRSDAYQQAAKSDAPASSGAESKSEGTSTGDSKSGDGKPSDGDKAKPAAEAKPAAAPSKAETTAKSSSAKPSSSKKKK